jgi:hypothetical protein
VFRQLTHTLLTYYLYQLCQAPIIQLLSASVCVFLFYRQHSTLSAIVKP